MVNKPNTDKIKTVGFILLTTYKIVIAHVLLLPALLVGYFAILIITFDFQDAREFSDGTDLTYILSGKGLSQGLGNIRMAANLLKGNSKA